VGAKSREVRPEGFSGCLDADSALDHRRNSPATGAWLALEATQLLFGHAVTLL
jgi:hypothetical protein